MIVQVKKDNQNVNDLLYQSERQRVEILNKEFFYNIELTEQENTVLIWLCDWDDRTFDAVVSVLRKVKEK